jgi:hypothetical protein
VRRADLIPAEEGLACKLLQWTVQMGGELVAEAEQVVGHALAVERRLGAGRIVEVPALPTHRITT